MDQGVAEKRRGGGGGGERGGGEGVGEACRATNRMFLSEKKSRRLPSTHSAEIIRNRKRD